MKILKYLFFLLLIAVIAVSIYYGTKDGSFDIAESKTIDAPAQVVYDNVKDFKNWEAWGPWMAEDPNIQITFAEKTEGEGGSYSWTSEVMGNGAMEIVKVIPGKAIDQKILFNTPFGDSKSDVYWRFDDTDTPGQTKVTWGMKGEQSFMEKVYSGLIADDEMEPQIREMYTSGLTKLDSVITSQMKQYTVSVDGITQYEGGYYMYATTSSSMSDVGVKMGQVMGQVMGYMQENKIALNGKPFTVYNQVDTANNSVIFSAGIPVKDRVITPSGSPVVAGFMEPVTTLKTTLKGNYDNLQQAYEKANEYMAQNGLTPHPTAKMFEVYITDPGEVPNPANYITEVYMPILVPQQP
jgi:effector-binding domain-containing protein